MIVRDQTMSGNLVFNDTVMQLSVNELPFGGVGESGRAYYTFFVLSIILLISIFW